MQELSETLAKPVLELNCGELDVKDIKDGDARLPLHQRP